MIYNRKEHEKWKKRGETDPSCCLVLLDFEWEKSAFIKNIMGFYP